MLGSVTFVNEASRRDKNDTVVKSSDDTLSADS